MSDDVHLPRADHPMFNGKPVLVECCDATFSSPGVMSQKERRLITKLPCPKCGARDKGSKIE